VEKIGGASYASKSDIAIGRTVNQELITAASGIKPTLKSSNARQESEWRFERKV